MDQVIKIDRCEKFRMGRKLRFVPQIMNEQLKIAGEIEILN